MLLLLSTKEILFFEPYLIFHLPQEFIPHFVLIIIFSGLISLVTSLAIYQIRMLKINSKKTGTGLIGSFIGVGAGVCTSCGQIGFSIVTTFGVSGATALSFLYDYEIPIRLSSVAILGITYFMMIKGISMECRLPLNKKID